MPQNIKKTAKEDVEKILFATIVVILVMDQNKTNVNLVTKIELSQMENVLVISLDTTPEKHIVIHAIHLVLHVLEKDLRCVPHVTDNFTTSKIKKLEQVLVDVMKLVKLALDLKKINVNLVMRIIIEPLKRTENADVKRDSLIKMNHLVLLVTMNVRLALEQKIMNVQAVKENITVDQLKVPALVEIILKPMKHYQVE